MTNPLLFCGSSDDTFGEYGRTDDDYDNCASGNPIVWRVWSSSESTGLLVVGQYGQRSAGWTVGVEQLQDTGGDPADLPSWPIRIRSAAEGEPQHSPVLEISAPDDAEIRCLQRGDSDD